MHWPMPKTLSPRFAGLGLLGGDRVVQYGAKVTVANFNVFGDGSGATLGLQAAFERLGYLARVSKPDVGWFTTDFHVLLSKRNRAPFSVNDAKAAIMAAAAQQSMNFKTLAENVGEIIRFQAEILPTAVSDKGRRQTQETIAEGAKRAGEQVDKVTKGIWENIPTSVKVVGGVAVGLFVLAQVGSIARVFAGVEGGDYD